MSVRVLIPEPGHDELVIPPWDGNAFRFADGSRPTIRTLTPQQVDAQAGRIALDVVIHEAGIASAWATAARPGDPAACSGPARGHVPDPAATRYVLLGDETAIPAIGQLAAAMPSTVAFEIHIELSHPDARLDLGAPERAALHWHDVEVDEPHGATLLAALRTIEIDDGTRVWAAGEAAGMQRIRKHLFTERGLERSVATVRGYWKHGRRGD